MATALVGLLVGLTVSVAAWVYFGTVLFFLFLPFVPFLFRSRETGGDAPFRRCPTCGFETRTPDYEYCPRDGAHLSTAEANRFAGRSE
ncbi:hypothetical protein [Natrononativus amylolyticus]|uniref:hypothetical protein n=1 Tax=Natrononativus amylolyticus TaxID=2963434 RepID=UPI0031F2F2FA